MTDEQVREHVIATADRLYYERGISSVGMDALRTASGVSLKRLYGLFPSKDSIVLAVLRHRHDQWTTRLSAHLETVETPREKLLAIYDYLTEWFDDDTFRGCGFINAFGELGGVAPDVARVVREHKQSFQDYVAKLVRAAGAPAELAPQLAILAEGAQTTAAIAGTDDAARQARDAAEVLIKASKAPDHAS